MDDEYKTSALEIGQRIASRRSQLGLTQEQAAELSGLSHQFFACVERGMKNMRAESVMKISRSMHVSTDYILFGKNSDIDRSYLLERLEPLSDVQFRCLEEIIRNYMIACGYPDPTDIIKEKL